MVSGPRGRRNCVASRYGCERCFRAVTSRPCRGIDGCATSSEPSLVAGHVGDRGALRHARPRPRGSSAPTTARPDAPSRFSWHATSKSSRGRDGARELRFVLFDGEEPPQGLPEESTDFYSSGLRGSRAYVARHAATTRAMVLLDYVANRGLRLPREASSTPALWAEIRAAAREAGHVAVFPDEDQQGSSTTTLHSCAPASRRSTSSTGVTPATTRETLDKLSERSVDAVGETLVQFVRRLDQGH